MKSNTVDESKTQSSQSDSRQDLKLKRHLRSKGLHGQLYCIAPAVADTDIDLIW